MMPPDSGPPPETATSSELLAALIDESERGRVAWFELDARLRPILFGFARRLGLSQEDASDVSQETLMLFVREYRAGSYARERGRLRSYILGIARNRVLDALRRNGRTAGQRGDSAIEQIESDDEFDAIWTSECRAHVLALAFDDLRKSTIAETTLRAFDLYAREGRPAEEVASMLGVTANVVYLAKFHCLKRLRDATREIEAREDMF